MRFFLQTFASNQVCLASPDFHPTLSAVSKEYHYFICNGPVQIPMHRLYSWHIHQPLNIEQKQQAALDFIGEHDFSALTNEPTDHNIRIIQKLAIQPLEDNRLRIEIRADRFLY
jgi:tRNA pseudouridine38-40 synthase